MARRTLPQAPGQRMSGVGRDGLGCSAAELITQRSQVQILPPLRNFRLGSLGTEPSLKAFELDSVITKSSLIRSRVEIEHGTSTDASEPLGTSCPRTGHEDRNHTCQRTRSAAASTVRTRSSTVSVGGPDRVADVDAGLATMEDLGRVWAPTPLGSTSVPRLSAPGWRRRGLRGRPPWSAGVPHPPPSPVAQFLGPGRRTLPDIRAVI
jgi:hypothetical protein